MDQSAEPAVPGLSFHGHAVPTAGGSAPHTSSRVLDFFFLLFDERLSQDCDQYREAGRWALDAIGIQCMQQPWLASLVGKST